MRLKNYFVLLVFVMAISFVYADVPAYQDKYVNDFAGVLSSTQVGELRGLLSSVDTDTTAELVFVSDNNCSVHGDPSQYATDILNGWQVGKADKNNGMVALYCSTENKFWVSVGYGLEGILPDSVIGRMLDESYVPLRDSGNVSEGIISFMQNVSDVIEQNKAEVLSGQTSGSSNNSSDVSVFIYFIIFWVVFTIIIKIIQNSYKKAGKKMPWFIPLLIPLRVGGGGFGGGGFGGGGFGGGAGGGGGAGR